MIPLRACGAGRNLPLLGYDIEHRYRWPLVTLVLIALAALAASAVSLLSGFGLGTVLLPVFALFLPLPVAVGATAVVHLASNAAKLLLMARHARAPVVLRFGIPAAFAALGGAALLGWIDRIPPLGAYAIGGRVFEIVAVKALIGSLMIAFAVLELLPRAASASVPARWMPLGGLLSGFFGGLSGHQGALRSMFLLRAGLTKEQFVATGVVCAAMVDVARLSVYGPGVFRQPDRKAHV